VYTALFTPDANVAAGTAGISVGAGAYTDAFGNGGGGASAPAISIDTLAPTGRHQQQCGAVKAGETAIVTFTFSERRPAHGGRRGHHRRRAERAGGERQSAGLHRHLHAHRRHPEHLGQHHHRRRRLHRCGRQCSTAAPAPSLTIDTLPPTAVGSSVTFSADNGSSASDLVTNASSQNLSGTLAGALGSGETVEVSLDNGASGAPPASAAATGPCPARA
jgi:hypothetical protein